MQRIVILSGAGISAESGLKTFRDTDGLWENYKITDVATPEAFEENPKLVLDFYNLRRQQVMDAQPNNAHLALVSLENKYEVIIITQNIDNLHEKAGSKNVLHLHGEILKARSLGTDLTYSLKTHELNFGDVCENGHQLRPDVVWFGESVPNIITAIEICEKADIFIIIGTSLNVYPAANLINHVPDKCEKYLVDPNNIASLGIKNLTIIKEKASIGIPILAGKLLK